VTTEEERQEVTIAAINRAGAGADTEWKTSAMAALKAVAVVKPEFTSDDVAEEMETNHSNVHTHDKRAMGHIFVKAAKAGVISQTGRFVRTRQIKMHKCPLRVWKSNELV
jgi:hypothetical protein